MTQDPRFITATEINRLNHGPWTPEEQKIIDEKNKEFRKIFIDPILDPLIAHTFEILKKLEIK